MRPDTERTKGNIWMALPGRGKKEGTGGLPHIRGAELRDSRELNLVVSKRKNRPKEIERRKKELLGGKGGRDTGREEAGILLNSLDSRG